jgi:hypothetical protein
MHVIGVAALTLCVMVRLNAAIRSTTVKTVVSIEC